MSATSGSESDTSESEECPPMKCKRQPICKEEWFNEMLTNYHNHINFLQNTAATKVEAVTNSYTFIDENEEDAQTALSDIHCVHIVYNVISKGLKAENKASLIIKQLPRDPFSRFFVKEAQFDIREMKFYSKIIPDMIDFTNKYSINKSVPYVLPVPKCYSPVGDFEPKEDTDVVLVLQNLKESGYYGPRFSDGLTLEEASSALKAMATIHAISLAMKIEYQQNLNERYPFLFQNDKATDSYQMLIERGLPQLGIFLEKRTDAKIYRSILNLRVKTKQIISSLLTGKEPLALLTHTDFWCNNLLFHGTSKNCVILDWQMVTYSCLTNDIALLILSSLPTELRRQHTQTLLDIYWEAFIQCSHDHNVNVEETFEYTKQDLKEDFKKSQLLAILLCIGSVDIALGNQVTEERLLNLLEDLFEAKIFSNEIIDECVR